MKIDFTKIQYSVIYTADIYCWNGELALPGKTRPISIRRYLPRGAYAKKMVRTEDSGDGWDESDSVAAHGKWCGVLTYAEFKELLRDSSMDVEEVETMGSLGAPGFDFGCVPAVCFRAPSDEYLGPDWSDDVMAYVTPLITNEQVKEWGLHEGDDVWDFIQKEMWAYAW